jgi:hypothetical protein
MRISNHPSGRRRQAGTVTARAGQRPGGAPSGARATALEEPLPC